MNIGLFFGSFNPIHTGHLIIANTVLNEFPVSKIWFVVSPQNPLKERSELLAAANRLELVRSAIENDQRLDVSDAEFTLPIPSYTIDSINYFETNFSQHTFFIIIGSDSFLQLHEWKDYNAILKKNLIIYQRPDYPIKNIPPKNIKILNSPLLNISATEIRLLIKKRKSIKYFVPEKVLQLIENQCFYK